MNISPNNNIVSLASRRWLGQAAREALFLDREMADLIERVVDQCRGVQPGGAIYDVARDLGAPEPRALAAGSLAELFYALCSFTDDLQDGDADAYLAEVPVAVRLNVGAHLQCLVAIRARDVVGADALGALLHEMYAGGARMLYGQHHELVRRTWNITSYEKVARLSAGGLFAFLFQISAFAADTPRDGWRTLGEAFGSLLQILADLQQGDERLLKLPAPEVAELGRQFASELKTAGAALGPAGMRIAQATLKQTPWAG